MIWNISMNNNFRMGYGTLDGENFYHFIGFKDQFDLCGHIVIDGGSNGNYSYEKIIELAHLLLEYLADSGDFPAEFILEHLIIQVAKEHGYELDGINEIEEIWEKLMNDGIHNFYGYIRNKVEQEIAKRLIHSENDHFYPRITERFPSFE